MEIPSPSYSESEHLWAESGATPSSQESEHDRSFSSPLASPLVSFALGDLLEIVSQEGGGRVFLTPSEQRVLLVKLQGLYPEFTRYPRGVAP